MNRMRTKRLFQLIFIGVILLIIPLVATAEPVAWSSQSYWAYANAYVSDGYDIYAENSQESFGPPLTINASASASWPLINPKVGASASSAVSAVDMQVATGANACCELGGYSNAIASFIGTYTATAPYFQFTYAYSGNIDENFDGAWFSVNDVTVGTSLYDGELSALSSDTISVLTPLGHAIEVSFGQQMDSITYAGQRTNTLSYSTAVAPEPISSVLFIMGGSLLAGRRFIKMKA